MWSYVQKRRIEKSAETEITDLRNKESVNGSPTPTDTNDLHRPSGTSPSASSAGPQDKDNRSHRHDEDADSKSNGRILVEQTGPDDPFIPKNWPLVSRSKNIAILAFLISCQAWAGAADSIASSKSSTEFHVSKVAQSLGTAMYLFGIGSGCLFVGRLSESIGRNPTNMVFTFCYLFAVLGTALVKNYGGYIMCRYLVGLFASATLGINGASVKDQFHNVKRAFVFPIIAWANIVRKL
jgi:DHA1 family multidrug resistance protein-like MFS transporter